MSHTLDLDHYNNLPVCGYCGNVWDMLYLRVRLSTDPVTWLGHCRHNGCDPDIWTFIDEGTGWFGNWPLEDNGRPDWALVIKTKLPPYDNRVFHRRESDGLSARWRAEMPKLYAKWSVLRGKGREHAMIKNGEVEWEDGTVQVLEEDEVLVLDDEEIEW